MVLEGATAVAGVGLAGGVLAEILHWWNLREDKQLPEYAKRLQYWMTTLAMILPAHSSPGCILVIAPRLLLRCM